MNRTRGRTLFTNAPTTQPSALALALALALGVGVGVGVRVRVRVGQSFYEAAVNAMDLTRRPSSSIHEGFVSHRQSANTSTTSASSAAAIKQP
jgi:hypothetical protein